MTLSAIAAIVFVLQSASLEGVIVRNGSGEGISGAEVTLSRTAGSLDGTPPPRSIPAIVSDSEGKFVFEDLSPGFYSIAVARNGYVRQQHAQRGVRGEGPVISVAEGQALRDVVVRLIPAGNVNGRVTDSTGEPVVGVRVQLRQPAYDERGNRTLREIGSARTNDRGEYRLYWVTPGRYFVTAAGGNPDQRSEGSSPNEAVAKTYPSTYYPGVTDLSEAPMIEVQPAAELSAIDVVLRTEQLYRIRGRVIDARTGRPPENVQLVISRRNVDAAFGFSELNRNYTPSDGAFEFRNVPPGNYWVHATTALDPNTAITPDASPRTVTELFATLISSRPADQVAVDLGRSDIEGLVLSLTTGISVPGVLRVEGRELSTLEGAQNVHVSLIPVGPNEFVQLPRPMRLDGVFSLDNVLRGEYRVTVTRLPRDAYVKEARFDAIDLLREPLVISGPRTGSLMIVLSLNGGQINGTLIDDRSRPVPGSLAVLVPDQNRDRTELYKTATTDQSGQFIFSGIPPGEYKIFAWEAIDPFEYFDPEFLRQSEQKGERVTVGESSRVTAQVKIIPNLPGS